ncbi:MaoC/PaaZ C-terminal domain-containing protein [Streptomyces sp. NPDC058525]|uniref:MaoC family dehydratase n=1 Tax=Streptomyces sp. NPDC058525 TaxID=3346538 RepID=UPI00365AB2D2
MPDPSIPTTPGVRRFDRPPGVIPSYLRAVARARAGRTGRPLPDRRAVLPDVTADPAHLAAYAEVCGFRQDGTLPATYPHLLAFSASLALMTEPDFPLPLLGLVHTANTITTRRPIGVGEQLSLEVRTADLHPHPRGSLFDVISTVHAGPCAEEVWASRSSYLFRHPTDPAAAAPASEPSPEPALPRAQFEPWRLPADTGRRYAAVSGDRNPIHLHPWTARLFGFPRAIAHGMWTKARVLAALGDDLPEAAEIEVSFRAPVPLPAKVRLSTAASTGWTDLALTDAAGQRVHLRGSVTAR